MTSSLTKVLLNNVKSMPIIGLGTWNSPRDQVAEAVKIAVDTGYRSIDCAYHYGNEKEIGEGLNAKIKEGVIKREDMFMTSKLWNTFHRPDLVRGALETTLKSLNTKYLDLFLMHFPFAYKEGESLKPKDEKGNVLLSFVDFVDTWLEMEKAVDDGLAISIGISNFNKSQMEKLFSNCYIPPAVHQFECHPYLIQKELSEYCKSKGVAVTAYSPLNSPHRPWVKDDDPVLLEEPKLLAIANKYSKTPAQILIRYQIQRGHIVIPKSVHKKHIIENFNVFDFNLIDYDMILLESFDRDGRFNTMPAAAAHPEYPFNAVC